MAKPKHGDSSGKLGNPDQSNGKHREKSQDIRGVPQRNRRDRGSDAANKADFPDRSNGD